MGLEILLVELREVQGCAIWIEHSDRALIQGYVLLALLEATEVVEILVILCCSVRSQMIILRFDGQERCDYWGRLSCEEAYSLPVGVDYFYCSYWSELLSHFYQLSLFVLLVACSLAKADYSVG